jgi:hypothetical protein
LHGRKPHAISFFALTQYSWHGMVPAMSDQISATAAEQIEAIAARAKSARVGMVALCGRAGVDYSTVWRWRTGRVPDPHPTRVAEVTGALDLALVEFKREIEAA